MCQCAGPLPLWLAATARPWPLQSALCGAVDRADAQCAAMDQAPPCCGASVARGGLTGDGRVAWGTQGVGMAAAAGQTGPLRCCRGRARADLMAKESLPRVRTTRCPTPTKVCFTNSECCSG